ncbi:LytTR family transcriptional regulator DNA-binding domain-containing protein [Parabacteroides sp. PF5-6]|uniref:LytTR family transcriptional regulator DNA-binding domain-containing protein n=1 Tax=Parabacteroides sp. PF5-6 TaxID=1742403 RepID=UPI002404FE48|nr:LytTR family transcriptional regulator DNA-binding domain-containing protein [Parabacteroides sp. PF5-6]MDF9828844.1 DNA-binding LytR/AlgR family response regulator [Parabacteroides sp. PF5-6]
MGNYLIISTSNDLIRIMPDRIVYISSDGNYSNLIQADGESRLLSYQLGQIEKMINSQLESEGSLFVRIGKSLIVNRNFIHYINIAKQRIILSDATAVNYTLSASREALKLLKELIEKEGK